MRSPVFCRLELCVHNCHHCWKPVNEEQAHNEWNECYWLPAELSDKAIDSLSNQVRDILRSHNLVFERSIHADFKLLAHIFGHWYGFFAVVFDIIPGAAWFLTTLALELLVPLIMDVLADCIENRVHDEQSATQDSNHKHELHVSHDDHGSSFTCFKSHWLAGRDCLLLRLTERSYASGLLDCPIRLHSEIFLKFLFRETRWRFWSWATSFHGATFAIP